MADIICRNGAMPYRYSPPAMGVFSAAVTRGQSLVVVGGGDTLQPKQADVFDTAADVDGFAHHADAAAFFGRGGIAGQRHLGLHLLEALLHQDLRRPLRLRIRQAAP